LKSKISGWLAFDLIQEANQPSPIFRNYYEFKARVEIWRGRFNTVRISSKRGGNFASLAFEGKFREYQLVVIEFPVGGLPAVFRSILLFRVTAFRFSTRRMIADRSSLAFCRASFCASVNSRGEYVGFIRTVPFDSSLPSIEELLKRGRLLTVTDLRLVYWLGKCY